VEKKNSFFMAWSVLIALLLAALSTARFLAAATSDILKSLIHEGKDAGAKGTSISSGSSCGNVAG
jgi:hypothetical protein